MKKIFFLFSTFAILFMTSCTQGVTVRRLDKPNDPLLSTKHINRSQIKKDDTVFLKKKEETVYDYESYWEVTNDTIGIKAVVVEVYNNME